MLLAGICANSIHSLLSHEYYTFNGNGLFLAGDGATFCHAVPDCLQRTSYIVSRSQTTFAKRERLFGRLPGDEGNY